MISSHTPPSSFNFNAKHPLTLSEKKLILRANADGLSIAGIVAALRDAGHRRGNHIVRDFLRGAGFDANHNTGPRRVAGPPRTEASQQLYEHSCIFCDWRGQYTDYYAHWRTRHRSRAGLTRREVEDHRHAT